jgi:hypothetical protein
MSASLCSVLLLLLSAIPRHDAVRQQPVAGNRPLHRWFDLQSATIETRYRFVDSSAGVTTANQWQHKQNFRGALKLDAGGRFTIHSQLGTGSTLTSTWDPTGVGTGDPTWHFRVRRLYAQAVPLTGLELAAGSFDVLRGESTEITSFDNDAFIEGYRFSVKRPAELYLDEVSVTLAYLGDLSQPNVFDRFNRMDDHNYSQVLVAKKFSTAVSVTADWTSLDHITTLRQAVRVSTPALAVVDGVRFENYQRIDGDRGYGFAVAVDRALTTRVTAGGGFARTDRTFLPLNGDRYGRGRRLFTETRIAMRPDLTFAVFYTHAVANDFPVAVGRRLDLLLSYNVLRALQRAHLW